MALIYNSLDWSLKCNSDDDAVNSGDALHAFVPHRGWGGGGGMQLFFSDYTQIVKTDFKFIFFSFSKN